MRLKERKIWNAFLGIMVAIVLCMAGSKILTGWSSVFSYRMFYIMSGSMEPEIYEHQMVVGKQLSQDCKLIEGEIYAYRRKGILGNDIVIHRLCGILDDGRYQFQGDANEFPDEAVLREDVGYQIFWY